jgi:multiple sugar transport system permease protein
MSSIGATSARERVSKYGRLEWRTLPVALAFILPAALGYALLQIYPAIRGIYLSFTDYSVFQSGSWVGLENYQRMLEDGIFWKSLGITVYYVILNIGFQTVLALALAVLMHRLTQSMLVRSIILTPYLISNVIAAMVWLLLADYQLGIVNQIIEAIGFDRLNFFGSEALVIPTIAFVNVWRHLGYTALLIFAGLQTISHEVYEAGRMDGASEFRMFRSITIPLLRPFLAMVLIVTMIGSFQVFDTVAVATKGGPANASYVIQYYIYESAFSYYEFGYASALSVALLVVLGFITFIQFRMSRANESDLN